MADKKLLLIDGNSVAFRAFYALFRQLENFRNPEGLHTNAIYTFKNMLDVVLNDVKPDHVLVAFDAGKTTFRNNMYADYKGGRQKTPSELSEQLPYIQELLHDLGISTYELDNYEADDIIGTFATIGEKEGFKVTVVTGDKDLTQLASPQTTVMVTKSGVLNLEAYTPEHMKEVNGVTPTEFIDMKALMGDNSDNYPGVTKIGPKKASQLIQEYGSVENLYDHIDDMKPSKMKENLINDKDKALLGKKLATIDRHTPLTIGIDDIKWREVDYQKLRRFYEKMNFRKFLSQLDPESAAGQKDQPVKDNKAVAFTELKENDINNFAVKDGQTITFYLGMLGANYHLADFVGFAIKIDKQIYVSRNVDLLKEPQLKNILENKQITKNVFDLKRTTVGLNRLGIHARGIDYDMLLASYLINNENNSDDMGEICRMYGDNSVKSDYDVYGKGKSAHIPEDDQVLFNHLAGKIEAIENLKETLLAKLKEHEQDDLFANIEIPVARVLSVMEINGIKVQAETLTQLQDEFAVELKKMEKQIYDEAGEEFNINSPKQLGHICLKKWA